MSTLKKEKSRILRTYTLESSAEIENVVMRALQTTSPDVVPPHNQLCLGACRLDPAYKAALYEEFPWYTSKQIVSSFLGFNTDYVSHDQWKLYWKGKCHVNPYQFPR